MTVVPTTIWKPPFLVYSLEFETTALELVQALYSAHHRVVSFPLPRWGESPHQYPADSPSVRTSPWCRNDPHGEEKHAVIVFTSSASGQAKGARLSHRAVWVQCQAKLAASCGYHAGTRPLSMRCLLYPVGGPSIFLAEWLAGGVLVDCTPPQPTELSSAASFDPETILASVTNPDAAVSTLVVVPTMLYALQQRV
jgi:acyl-CoA synthetase (AMP-forming)/AMP-acid ligase II